MLGKSLNFLVPEVYFYMLEHFLQFFGIAQCYVHGNDENFVLLWMFSKNLPIYTTNLAKLKPKCQIYFKTIYSTPLCTTRWLTRVSAIKAMLTQYETILECLDKLAESDASINTRVSGISEQLSRANALLSIFVNLSFRKWSG